MLDADYTKGGRSCFFTLVPRASEVYSSGVFVNRKYQVAEAMIMVLPGLQLGCTAYPPNAGGKDEATVDGGVDFG